MANSVASQRDFRKKNYLPNETLSYFHVTERRSDTVAAILRARTLKEVGRPVQPQPVEAWLLCLPLRTAVACTRSVANGHKHWGSWYFPCNPRAPLIRCLLL